MDLLSILLTRSFVKKNCDAAYSASSAVNWPDAISRTEERLLFVVLTQKAFKSYSSQAFGIRLGTFDSHGRITFVGSFFLF